MKNKIIIDLLAKCFTDEQGEIFDHEKFAELIIRQCLYEIVHECMTNHTSNIQIQDFMVNATKRIETRFGIENGLG